MRLMERQTADGRLDYVTVQDPGGHADLLCAAYDALASKMLSPSTLRISAVFLDGAAPADDASLRCVFDASEEPALLDAVLATKGLKDEGRDTVSCLRPEMIHCLADPANLVPVVAMDAATYIAVNTSLRAGAGWATLHLLRASVAARLLRASERMIVEADAINQAYNEICAGTFASLAAACATENSESIVLLEHPGLATLVHRVVSVARLIPAEPLPLDDLDGLAERALASVEQFAVQIGYAPRHGASPAL